MLSSRAVFDGNYLELIIYGPFQSISQNILYIFDASVPTRAITQSSNFGLASAGQLLNKYPFNQLPKYQPLGNRPVVAYEAVCVILSPQLIHQGSEQLDAKKLNHFYYEFKSNFTIAFGTVGSIISVWSPIGTGCGRSPIGLAQPSLMYAYNSWKQDNPAASNQFSID
ncbi:MAG: hypothetical protein EZS28_016605 [Streblomastix strix]|uniref:Uncharacterized protein n=1 Tax=Streblomastix strix TaxID=222440 RepID=A0A5J4VYZ7_9EUKA|nr:MAG: hypothetical protein EZS28_016605 [Streblomastix strix]